MAKREPKSWEPKDEQRVRASLWALLDFGQDVWESLDALDGAAPTFEQREGFDLLVRLAGELVPVGYERNRRMTIVYHLTKTARDEQQKKIARGEPTEAPSPEEISRWEGLPSEYRTPKSLEFLAAAVAAGSRDEWLGMLREAAVKSKEDWPRLGPSDGESLRQMVLKHEMVERRVLRINPAPETDTGSGSDQ